MKEVFLVNLNAHIWSLGTCKLSVSQGLSCADWLDFNQTLASWQVDGLPWWHCFLHPFVVHWHVMNYQSRVCMFVCGIVFFRWDVFFCLCFEVVLHPLWNPRDFRGTKVPQFSLLNIEIDFFGICFLAVCLPEITAYVPHKSSSYFLGIHLGGPGWFELCHGRVAGRLWSFGPWHLVMMTLPILNMYTPGRFFRLVHLQPSPMKRKKNHLKTIHLEGMIFQPLIFSCCTLPYS